MDEEKLNNEEVLEGPGCTTFLCYLKDRLQEASSHLQQDSQGKALECVANIKQASIDLVDCPALEDSRVQALMDFIPEEINREDATLLSSLAHLAARLETEGVGPEKS